MKLILMSGVAMLMYVTKRRVTERRLARHSAPLYRISTMLRVSA